MVLSSHVINVNININNFEIKIMISKSLRINNTEVDRPGVVCDQAGDGGLGDGAGQDDDLVAVESLAQRARYRQ